MLQYLVSDEREMCHFVKHIVGEFESDNFHFILHFHNYGWLCSWWKIVRSRRNIRDITVSTWLCCLLLAAYKQRCGLSSLFKKSKSPFTVTVHLTTMSRGKFCVYPITTVYVHYNYIFHVLKTKEHVCVEPSIMVSKASIISEVRQNHVKCCKRNFIF